MAEGDKPPRGVRSPPPPPPTPTPGNFWKWTCAEMQSFAFRDNFEKCYSVCTNLLSSCWFFRFSYLYTVMITIFWGWSFYSSNTLDRTLTAYLLPHHGKLSYGRRPRQLWQRRYAAGDKGSRVNRHQGRGVGRQEFPSPERGQKDNDRGKTREFKQRDSKETRRHRARRIWRI